MGYASKGDNTHISSLGISRSSLGILVCELGKQISLKNVHFSCAALAADANSQGSIEAGNGEVGFGNPHWECNFLKETWDTRARGDVSHIALRNF